MRQAAVARNSEGKDFQILAGIPDDGGGGEFGIRSPGRGCGMSGDMARSLSGHATRGAGLPYPASAVDSELVRRLLARLVLGAAICLYPR